MIERLGGIPFERPRRSFNDSDQETDDGLVGTGLVRSWPRKLCKASVPFVAGTRLKHQRASTVRRARTLSMLCFHGNLPAFKQCVHRWLNSDRKVVSDPLGWCS